ncbi:MAG TPA: hypothetical protein V6D43_06070, partial [Candidatus Sericytochromatia bacterium]
VPGVPAASGLSGLSGLTGVSGVQDYVSSTTPLPSTGSYATGVSPSQPSTATPTDIVRGI